jgi:hypothetical protein
MKRMFIVFIGLMVLAGCATTTATKKYEGTFVPEEYVSKFEPGTLPHTMHWIRPGVDFSKYHKMMVDYVVFALAPDSEYKGIDADEMKKLADAASKALVDALAEKFPIVSEPGPDVIRVKFAIVDLKQSKPALSVITTVLPVGLGISLIKKGVGGEWTGGGMTKGEVLFLDSMTNQVLAAGYGDYSAAFGERFTKWGQVEEAFKKWGEQVDKAYASIVAAEKAKGTQ